MFDGDDDGPGDAYDLGLGPKKKVRAFKIYRICRGNPYLWHAYEWIKAGRKAYASCKLVLSPPSRPPRQAVDGESLGTRMQRRQRHSPKLRGRHLWRPRPVRPGRNLTQLFPAAHDDVCLHRLVGGCAQLPDTVIWDLWAHGFASIWPGSTSCPGAAAAAAAAATRWVLPLCCWALPGTPVQLTVSHALLP